MNRTELDIASNRRARKYERSVTLRRVLWTLCQPLFRMSPRPLFAWRSWLLRVFGARIGEHVHVYGTTRVYMPWNLTVGNWSTIGEWTLVYNLGMVTIGEKATVSHGAHLCAGTHDFEKPDLPLRRPRIVIGSQAWICADAFVGPGITIGDGAVVGARAVVVRDVAPWVVVAGNPARTIRDRNMT